MFKEVWCFTPYWKSLLIAILLGHGAYNVLFFEEYLQLWQIENEQLRFFEGMWAYYSISYLPLLELAAGILLIFGFKKKMLLSSIFYFLLFAGYYALDSNYLSGFLFFFALAFFSLFVLFGQYYKKCREEHMKYKVPTGGM